MRKWVEELKRLVPTEYGRRHMAPLSRLDHDLAPPAALIRQKRAFLFLGQTAVGKLGNRDVDARVSRLTIGTDYFVESLLTSALASTSLSFRDVEDQAVSVVEPDGMADDFGRKAMPMVAGPVSVHPGIVPGGELT